MLCPCLRSQMSLLLSQSAAARRCRSSNGCCITYNGLQMAGKKRDAASSQRQLQKILKIPLYIPACILSFGTQCGVAQVSFGSQSFICRFPPHLLLMWKVFLCRRAQVSGGSGPTQDNYSTNQTFYWESRLLTDCPGRSPLCPPQRSTLFPSEGPIKKMESLPKQTLKYSLITRNPSKTVVTRLPTNKQTHEIITCLAEVIISVLT